MVSIEIRGGWFHQILAKPIQKNEFTFVPVLGDLVGEEGVVPYQRNEKGLTYPLSNYLQGRSLSSIAEFKRLNYPFYENDSLDALWVRARIPAIFGSDFLVTPITPDYKYSLVGQAFIACELRSDANWIAYLFICEDYDCCTGLRFSPDARFGRVYERIAQTFWELLLSEPEDLRAFSDAYLSYNEDFGDEAWGRVKFHRGRYKFVETEEPILWW
jgi:hypothetical protein